MNSKNIKKAAPIIMTLAGIALAGASIGLAIKETPKYKLLKEDALNDKRGEAEVNGEEPALTKKEEAKIIAKTYWPLAVTSTAAFTLILLAQYIQGKRINALNMALGIAEKAAVDRVKATIETVGEKKANEIEKKMEQNRLEEKPVKQVVLQTGQYVVRDYNTGAEFVSSVSQIEDAVRHYNDELDDGEWHSINAFYDWLGQENTGFGEYFGCQIDRIDDKEGRLKIEYTTTMNENDEPIIVLKYKAKYIYG